ncbi:MAG: DJ-1/PfpI family protein [Ferruginibacter sp.]
MKRTTMLRGAVITLVIAALLFNACSPIREFGRMPAYTGSNDFNYTIPWYDSSKKTVVIIANNDGTELFDMMAPYYLFNNTGKANVYIIAKNKCPVVVKKGFYMLPQLSFADIDSLQILPDVIVIPYLAVGDSVHQDPVIINWIKKHYTTETKILSVCDGAATAAATGIFDGKPITAHAADYAGISSQFSRPHWVQNTSVATSGNLYSTAGVSNAVEGSLLVIDALFGAGTMKAVMNNIAYPASSPKRVHHSTTFRFKDKLAVGKKIIFRKNRTLGVLLEDGISEFNLAAVMDTYNRTFPGSIESFSKNDQPVKTKYGLHIIPSGRVNEVLLDELHIIGKPSSSNQEKEITRYSKLVTHNNLAGQYIIDECLQRIRTEYGRKFEHVVKLMLDYN